MSGLTNMKKRLEYYGGAAQRDRMVQDKLRSLKKALLYSYQAAIVEINNMKDVGPRQFRCLINPNKINMDLDDKMLSIPFEDTRVDSLEVESIGVKPGDVIVWKGKVPEDDTHWLVYSRYLQERAYFRGLMRQCKDEVELEDGSRYWVYIKGPDEKAIDWQKTKHFIFNDLNYTLEMYISNTPEINQLLHRFKKVKIQGKNWEVQAVDRITTEGILGVYLKEDFTNKWETDSGAEPEAPAVTEIDGPEKVYPYDIITYTTSLQGGAWALSNQNAKIINKTDTSVEIEITTGRSGFIDLIYICANGDNIVKNITILSL